MNDFEEGFQSPAMHLSSVDGNIFEEFLENYNKGEHTAGASPRESLFALNTGLGSINRKI